MVSLMSNAVRFKLICDDGEVVWLNDTTVQD